MSKGATISTGPVISTEQIGIELNIRSRQEIYKIAKRDKWSFVDGTGRGRTHPRSYFLIDILPTVRIRQRRFLARAISKKFKKPTTGRLIRTDKFDIKCPKCGAFAIILPPPSTAGIEPSEISLEARPWGCVNGHSKRGRIQVPDQVLYSQSFLDRHRLDNSLDEQ